MAVQIPYNRETDFVAGRIDTLGPDLRRVTAPNPGPFTFAGTNTYIVGRGQVAVIDPGPAISAHFDALMQALKGETVTHILATHTHTDHSPLAARLQAETGAKTYGYGPHGSGKGVEGVKLEEGGDLSFDPDVRVRDGDVIEGQGFRITCIFTPGHTSNHVCFGLPTSRALVTGDHIMGWSTSVIAPPDGDMADYMASLDKVLKDDYATLWPAHGGPVRDPEPFLKAFIAHREEREAKIAEGIAAGVSTIPALVERIYVDVDRRLHPAAQWSVLAHIIRMVTDGRVRADGPPTLSAHYTPGSKAN